MVSQKLQADRLQRGLHGLERVAEGCNERWQKRKLSQFPCYKHGWLANTAMLDGLHCFLFKNTILQIIQIAKHVWEAIESRKDKEHGWWLCIPAPLLTSSVPPFPPLKIGTIAIFAPGLLWKFNELILVKWLEFYLSHGEHSMGIF